MDYEFSLPRDYHVLVVFGKRVFVSSLLPPKVGHVIYDQMTGEKHIVKSIDGNELTIEENRIPITMPIERAFKLVPILDQDIPFHLN
jgi:hypothetical protein